MSIKVLDFGDLNYDPAKRVLTLANVKLRKFIKEEMGDWKQFTGRRIEDILIEYAKQRGYQFITYTVNGLRYWTCTKCGFRVISEEDAKWHLKSLSCVSSSL